MRLIHNLVCAKLDDEYLLINTLNGLMDLIDDNTLEILKKWEPMEEITAVTSEEQSLFESLQKRGYLCTSREAEQAQKDSIIQALRELHQKNKTKISTITFVMTYDCNFRCPYCFEGIDHSLRGVYLNEEQIDAALAFAGDDLKHIGLFGGEPLLPRTRKAVEYLIQKAPDKSYDVITNGYYLDQFIDLFSKVDVSYIMVTLDGKKELHDKRRYLANGAPTYDVILANIQKALESGIPIRIRMNIEKETLAESTVLRKELLDKFADYKDLLSFEVSPMMGIDYRERNKLFGELAKVDFENKQTSGENVFLTRFSPVVNCVINGTKLRPTYSYCVGHQTGYIFDPFGLVYTCLVAVGKRHFAVGSYYPNAGFFETSLKCRNIETIEKCRDCAYSLICGGGCPINLGNTKDVYQPECGSILNDIHNTLPLLLRAKKSETSGADHKEG